MATLPAGIGLGFVVAAALAARLACANLDGALARDAGRGTAWGSVVNEVGDRLAEIAALAGLFFVAPAWQVIAAIAAASAPSWIALAGSTAGTARIQGGPVGKTERTVVLVLAAFTGGWVAALALVIGGSLVTALVRLATLRRLLASAASR